MVSAGISTEYLLPASLAFNAHLTNPTKFVYAPLAGLKHDFQ